MKKVNPKEKNLETLLAIIAGLLVIYIASKRMAFVTVSVLIALIGLFSSWLTAKIAWLWTGLSKILGAVMSRVILGLTFYLFLFPVAILARIFRKKDSMQLKRHNRDSYYSPRDHSYTKEDLENPW